MKITEAYPKITIIGVGVGAFLLTTLIATYFLFTYGLTGVGVAWIFGSGLAALAGFVLYRNPFNFAGRVEAIRYEWWVRAVFARRYFRARRAARVKKTVLFYPCIPKYYYVLFMICKHLGLKMTTDISEKADVAVIFIDETKRTPDGIEMELRKKYMPLINTNALDISKKKVEEIFKEVFGYGMEVDPRIFKGEYVQKSDANAMHDGKVIQCPTEPQAGYIYQRLINNREGDTVFDIRVKVVGGKIPFLMHRSRSAFDRFDNTKTSVMTPIDELLSKDEQEKILIFSQKMGIDFGALDCLRDRTDGRLYIVDANLTTGAPKPGVHCSYEEWDVYIEKFANAFKVAFIENHGQNR